MNAQSEIKIADVLTQTIDDEMVVLKLTDETYFSLDKHGAAFWEEIERHKTLCDISSALLARFDVEEEKLNRDLIAFINDLKKAGLVEVK